MAEWTRDVHDGARKMIVAEGNHGLSDSEGVVTRAEITSGEIASRWAQD